MLHQKSLLEFYNQKKTDVRRRRRKPIKARRETSGSSITQKRVKVASECKGRLLSLGLGLPLAIHSPSLFQGRKRIGRSHSREVRMPMVWRRIFSADEWGRLRNVRWRPIWWHEIRIDGICRLSYFVCFLLGPWLRKIWRHKAVQCILHCYWLT